MDRDEVVCELKAYITREFLDGDDEDLDERSPLLAWGVLNSLESLKLLSFIGDRFDVDLEPGTITPESLENIGTVADLVVRGFNRRRTRP